jgi:hypothetical protein
LTGFTQKINAKRFIDNNFILDSDYKLLLFPKEEQKGTGGRRAVIIKKLIALIDLIITY